MSSGPASAPAPATTGARYTPPAPTSTAPTGSDIQAVPPANPILGNVTKYWTLYFCLCSLILNLGIAHTRSGWYRRFVHPVVSGYVFVVPLSASDLDPGGTSALCTVNFCSKVLFFRLPQGTCWTSAVTQMDLCYLLDCRAACW